MAEVARLRRATPPFCTVDGTIHRSKGARCTLTSARAAERWRVEDPPLERWLAPLAMEAVAPKGPEGSSGPARLDENFCADYPTAEHVIRNPRTMLFPRHRLARAEPFTLDFYRPRPGGAWSIHGFESDPPGITAHM